jgi:hypothetical protein
MNIRSTPKKVEKGDRLLYSKKEHFPKDKRQWSKIACKAFVRKFAFLAHVSSHLTLFLLIVILWLNFRKG